MTKYDYEALMAKITKEEFETFLLNNTTQATKEHFGLTDQNIEVLKNLWGISAVKKVNFDYDSFVKNHPEFSADFYVLSNEELYKKYSISEKILGKLKKLLNLKDRTPEQRKAINLRIYGNGNAYPSRKGLPSTRSHESYVEAGKKSAETQRQHWAEKPEEEKRAWSQKQIDAHSSEDTRRKISEANKSYQANLSEEEREKIRIKKSERNKKTWQIRGDEIIAQSKQTCLNRYNVDNFAKSNKYKEIVSSEENRRLRAQRTHATKRVNNSFSCSKPEQLYYQYLCQKYGKEDVKRQYRDEVRYPFNCDFYIVSQDLFIELNLTWSHGGHLFDSTNQGDIEKLAVWKERAMSSEYYKNAIEVWTHKDVLKFETAKKNHLNYVVYYSEAELYK